jgi:hypothetical protein
MSSGAERGALSACAKASGAALSLPLSGRIEALKTAATLAL